MVELTYADVKLVNAFKTSEEHLRGRMTSILQALEKAIADFQAQATLLAQIQAEVEAGDLTRAAILAIRAEQLQVIEDDPDNPATAESYMTLVQELVGLGGMLVAKAQELDAIDPTLFPGYNETENEA